RQSIVDGSDDALARGRELYDLLLGPVDPLLASSQRVLLCLDGPLYTLPFAALVRGQRSPRFLAEWKPLHLALSATHYAELKKARKEHDARPYRLVAFGDPHYPAQADAGADPE